MKTGKLRTIWRSRAVRWLRVTSPPAWLVVLVLLAYALLEVQYRLVLLRFGAQQELGVFMRIRLALVLIATGAYAGFRVFAFHPIFRESYRNWLKLTPWRRGMRLPLGPLPVSGQDVLMLLIFQAMVYDAPWAFRFELVALFFGVIGAVYAAILAYMPKLRWGAYIYGYGFGAVIWLEYRSPPAALGVAFSLYVLTRLLMQRALSDFPWEEISEKWQKSLTKARQGFNQDQRQRSDHLSLGWPFDYLHPRRETEMSTGHKVLTIVLVSWCLWAIFSGPQGVQVALATSGLIVMVGIFCCVIRMKSYLWSHGPPISFWGRLFTFRWIIPSFDVAFAPIAAVPLTFLAAYIMFIDWQLPANRAVPLATGLFLHIVYVTCPRLERWRLTSKAQLRTWALPPNARDFEQL